MFWIPLLLAVTFQTAPTYANFGLSTSFKGVNLLISNAKSVNDALNSMTQNIRSLNVPGQTDNLQSVADLITQLTQNVTTLGQYLTGNVTKASADENTPITELFSMLHMSLTEMSEFLASDAQMITTRLNNTLGSTSITDITQALHSFHDIVLNITNITTNIEIEIGKSSEDSSEPIISNLTTSLTEAIAQMRNQAVTLSNVVASITRNVDSMNSYVTLFYSITNSAEQKLNSSQYVKSQIPAEKDNAIKRYTAYLGAITSDISAGVEKLDALARNRDLQPLINRHSEEYTRIFYDLYRRNTSDMMNISSTYDTIGSISEELALQSYSNFSNQMQRIVLNLTDVYLAQETIVESCYKKYSNELLNPVNNVQSVIGSCLYKERGRLGRISGATEQILQLVQQNSQDFAANIASCAAQTNYANTGDVFNQTKACLATNLDQMAEFQQTINSELDEMLRVYAVEIAASRFRLSNCLASRSNEAQAAARKLEALLDSCVADAINESKPESDRISDGLFEPDLEESGYELVDMLIR
ncbi:uncharacterized protein LOC129780369 [Toxorhynchites rutilus septentrionalis]|uniref:uncharacterized protein LOC129780369 n=1 Tax=Toxorhynchites rutilus septentrionalis TaxID=329112 RepID=UPI0024784C03|nr:uncharacterized protein LOC129780369 [Toxorhynchites rutilus septentrionalis]